MTKRKSLRDKYIAGWYVYYYKTRPDVTKDNVAINIAGLREMTMKRLESLSRRVGIVVEEHD